MDELSDELTDIAESIFEVGRLLATEFERAAADVSLTKQQALVLRALSEPRTMADLASLVGVDPSNLTNVVGRLEQLRLVSRRSGPTDRRTRLVALTSSGRRVRERFQRDLIASTRLARLDADQRRHLDDLLSQLRTAQPARPGASPRPTPGDAAAPR